MVDGIDRRERKLNFGNRARSVESKNNGVEVIAAEAGAYDFEISVIGMLPPMQ